MIEKYCDILVVGTELPGLITAAFLARRGLAVHVIDFDPYADHERAPEVACLTNIQSKLVRSILGRLNVPEMTIQSLASQDAALQFILPKHRIDILASTADYYQELEREFPDSLSDLRSFYDEQARVRHQTDVNELFQQLLPWTWQERRQLKKFIYAHDLDRKSSEFEALLKKNPLLSIYFRSQYLLANQCLVDRPFSYQIAELFNPGEGEIFSIHAGSNDIKRILIERITQHDGTIKKRVQLKSLLFRNGVFEGAEYDNPQGTILSKYVIWNAPLAKLKDLLPKKWRFRGLRKQCDLFVPARHWFSVRFSVDAKHIPDPMKSNVIDIKDPNGELSGTNFLYIQVHRDKNTPTASVDVHFLLPPDRLDASDESFTAEFDEIRARLLKIMPFSDPALKQIFPVKPEAQPADTLFPLHDNDFEVFRHNARINGVTPRNEKHFFDLFAMHYRTAAPNFFITHTDVFRGFGLESKLMLGLKVTDLIWQEAEKTKKRAMKSERRIA